MDIVTSFWSSKVTGLCASSDGNGPFWLETKANKKMAVANVVIIPEMANSIVGKSYTFKWSSRDKDNDSVEGWSKAAYCLYIH